MSGNGGDYSRIVSLQGSVFVIESKMLPKGFPLEVKYPQKIVETIVQYLHYKSINQGKPNNKLPKFDIEPHLALQLLKAATELGI